MPKPAANGGKPPTLFDRLRAALASKDATATELQREANAAAEGRDAALAELARLEGQGAEMLLADDAQRATYRTALADARDQCERLAALAEHVGRKLADVRHAEEQARRQAIYDVTQAKANDAAKMVERDYAKLCRQALGLLKSLAEAQREVNAANEQLPDGAAPINDPEYAARGLQQHPRKVLSEEEVILWVLSGREQPVPEEFQAAIHSTKDGKGWGKRDGDDEPVYLRARFLKQTVQQPTYEAPLLPLAVALRLPALKGDTLLWGVGDPFGVPGPMTLALLSGGAGAEQVLDRLVALDAEQPQLAPPHAAPEVRTEWTMLGYVDATPYRESEYDENYRPKFRTRDDKRRGEVPARAIPADMTGLHPTSRDARPTRLVQPNGTPSSIMPRVY